MAAKYTDFNYLALLRNLERAVVPRGESRALRATASADIISKGMNVARTLRLEFTHALEKLGPQRRSARKLSANLKLKCTRMQAQETQLIRNIEECAQGLHPSRSFRLAGWPPVVPVESMVSQFAAQAIGLQSEAPDGPFSEKVQATWSEVVAPALAWGILGQLQDANATLETRKAATERVRNADHAADIAPSKTSDLPYLRLAEAWFEVLQGTQPWQLSAHTIQLLRNRLANTVASDNVRELWTNLGEHFSHAIGGSARAKAVQLASRHLTDQPKAAFLRNRLVMLEASRLPTVQALAQATRSDPYKAVEMAKAWRKRRLGEPLEQRSPIDSGMAYWLAHMLYKAHRRPDQGVLNDASDLVCALLKDGEDAAQSEDQALLCLRYLAGYASNPRYHRSPEVLKESHHYIRMYTAADGRKPGLAALFEARYAWQLYSRDKTSNESDRHFANTRYAEALQSLETDALDSEAPVHLFPEILVVLEEQLSNKKGRFDLKGNEESLRLLDYIAQRSYGVYFDAPTERAAIHDGCEQFSRAPLADSLDQKIEKYNSIYANSEQANPSEDEKPKKMSAFDKMVLGHIESGKKRSK